MNDLGKYQALQRIASNTIRNRFAGVSAIRPFRVFAEPEVLPRNAKMLAWAIFLVYFIENGTLGLLPSSMYFVYRNVRISDLLIYGLIAYSFYNAKEYIELFSSKATIILKVMFVYFCGQFIVSTLLYNVNFIEYFFRLKNLWASFLVFPFLLLMKRNAFGYLIKLVFPVAVVSNILYILTAVTGIALMPGLSVVKQDLPGGLSVFRVFGGTFYGELFFLGFIFEWITNRFRLWQLFPFVLFVVPHILAFGRSAWVYLSLCVVFMFVWYFLKKKEFKVVLREIFIISIIGIALTYSFIRFIPSSEYLTEAIGARITQGEEDVAFKEGTYGSRLVSTDRLIDLWLNSNILFGIGMHPMWVIEPVTKEEGLYIWGFSDVTWPGVLASYGIIGFLLSAIFQIYFLYITLVIIKRCKTNDVFTFLTLAFFVILFMGSFINYSNQLLTAGIWGFSKYELYLAAIVYKYEHLNE